MNVVWTLLGEGELYEVVCEGIKERSRRMVVAALEQFIGLLDQHCVVKELVGSDFNLARLRIEKTKQGPEHLTSEAGEGKVQRAFVDITRIDRNKVGPLLVDSDWIALCQALYDGERIGSPCTTFLGRLQRRWVLRRLERSRVCFGN